MRALHAYLVACVLVGLAACATLPVVSPIPAAPAHPVYGPPTPAYVPPVPASDSPADKRIAAAIADRDAAHRALAESVARAQAADAQVESEREDKRIELAAQRAEAIAAWILWLTIACVLGIAAGCGAAAVAAIWGLGFGWKIPLGIAGGFLAALVAVRGTDLVIAHPLVTGVGFLALVAGAVCLGLWHLRGKTVVATELARFGTDAASIVRAQLPAEWDRLRGSAMERQAAQGIHHVVDRIAQKTKAKAAAKPARAAA